MGPAVPCGNSWNAAAHTRSTRQRWNWYDPKTAANGNFAHEVNTPHPCINKQKPDLVREPTLTYTKHHGWTSTLPSWITERVRHRARPIHCYYLLLLSYSTPEARGRFGVQHFTPRRVQGERKPTASRILGFCCRCHGLSSVS